MAVLRSFRSWQASLRVLLLALGGLTLPASAQELTQGATSVCRSMGPEAVLGICAITLIGTFTALLAMRRRLGKEGWSLANALSEPTRLTIPIDPRWSQSQRDAVSSQGGAAGSSAVGIGAAKEGPPVALTILEASSSRLIAMVGMVVIVLLYLGFGIFSLYTFGLTCEMPASTTAVTSFLYAGLTLFAPYAANKVSGILKPVLGSPSPSSPETAGTRLSSQVAAPPAPTHPLAQPPRPILPAAPKGRSIASGRPTLPATGVSPPGHAAANPYAPAVALIAEFEGFVDHAYPDPASGGDPWTIGYGFTSLNGQPVRPGDTLSEAEAQAQLARGVESYASHLGTSIPYWAAMAADQRCALISFAWNLGESFYGSDGFDTISARLRDKDWAAVPAALLLYCDPGSPVSAGLLRRRQAEADLWQQGLNAPTAAPAATPSSTAPMAKATGQAAHPNPLNVPWFDQLAMNDGQGWRDCFSASSAMLAAYWGKEPNEDDYNALRQNYGDSTSSEAQLAALRHLGLQAEFRTDGSLDSLKAEIDAGRPVAVGWLHHGPPSAPSGGGHWTVVIGYDATGVIMNDPYGSCDLVNGGYPQNHNGARQHYSYANWEPRWRPQGSGGWMLCAHA